MPEGVKSIADLVVRVGADVAPLEHGFSSVSAMMKTLEGATGSSLAGLTSIVANSGATVGTLAARLNQVGAVLTSIETAIQSASAVASLAASSLGAGDEYAAVEREASALSKTLTAVAEQGLATVKSEAEAAATALGIYASGVASADESSEDFAQRGLRKATEMLRELKLSLAEMVPIQSLDIDTQGELLEKTQRQLDDLKKRAADAAAELDRIGDNRGAAISDPNGDAQRQIAALEKQAWILGQFAAMERVPWEASVDTSKQDGYLNRLADEVALLEKRAALLGVAASQSSAALAAEKIRIEAGRQGIGFGPDAEGELDGLVARYAAAQDRIEAAAEAEKQRTTAAKQNDTAAGAIKGIQREVDEEIRRREAMRLTAGEAARLAAEERALAAIRASGREATESELELIRFSAAAKGREVDVTERLQDAQAKLAASTQVLGRTLENAFGRWASGAKMDVKEINSLLADMLQQLAATTFKQTIVDPLVGGGAGSGGGGILGELLGGLFDGFRADGGPVAAGRAYVVGERGPELFVPKSAGTILPNGAGGSAPLQMITQIDARGASVDAIQELRRVMAERDAAMPAQMLNMVRESRDRGLA